MKNILFGVVGVLLLVGCVQPTFNQNNKSISFISGKPYVIPQGARYNGSSFGSEKNAAILISLLRKAGLNCNVGDVAWFEENYAATQSKALSESNTELYISNARKAKSLGLAGCSHPLNKQEYDYYLNKENQKAAYNRAVASQPDMSSTNAMISNMQMQNRIDSISRQTESMKPNNINVYVH